MEKELIFYSTDRGVVPFENWLKHLRDQRAVAAIRSKLNRVRQGNFGDCKHLKSGVFELRIHYSPGYRIYFGKYADCTVVLLWGGNKSTQAKDIERAIFYWRAFKLELRDES